MVQGRDSSSRGPGGAFLQPRRIRHRPRAGRGRNRAGGLQRPGAVLRANVLHSSADRPRRHGASPPCGRNRKHGSGAYPHHTVRGRQDPHADGALPPGKSRGEGSRSTGRAGATARCPNGRGAEGSRRRVRRKRLGSVRGARDALDRHRAPVGGRQRRRRTGVRYPDHAAGNGSVVESVRRRERTRPAAVRRSAELREPASRHGGELPRLPAESDGLRDRHDGGRRRHQPAAQPGVSRRRAWATGRVPPGSRHRC